MTVPVDGYPALGFDPAPGDAEAPARFAAALESAAQQLTQLSADVRAVGTLEGGLWDGEAAQAFVRQLDNLPKLLGESECAVSSAGQKARAWEQRLRDLQQQAVSLEREAQAAQRRVEAAQQNPDLELAGQFFADPAQLAEAQRRYEAAARQLEAARQELEDLRRRARELLAEHERVSDDIALAIRRLAELLPHKSLLEQAGDAVLDWLDRTVGAVAHGIADFCEKNAQSLKNVGDLASTLSTVTALLATATVEIPPLAGALDLASSGFSLVALGAHGAAKLGGADVSTKTLLADAGGSIPLVNAVVKDVKGVKTAVGLAKVGIQIAGDFSQDKSSGGGGGGSSLGPYEPLKWFAPRNDVQAKGLVIGAFTGGVVPVALGNAFVNAWQAGQK